MPTAQNPSKISAAPGSWKSLAVVGVAVVSMLGGSVLVGCDTYVDDPSETAAVTAVDVPAATEAPPETPAPVDESASTAPASTAPASTAPASTAPSSTAPSSTAPAPMYATEFGLVNPCASVTHSPHPSSPEDPSHIIVSVIVVGLDGDIDPETRLGVNSPDNAFDPILGPIGPEGVTDVVVPIDRYGSHPIIFDVDGGAPSGTSSLEIEVDAAEGPVDGCTPADRLDDAAIDSLIGDLG